MSGAWRQARPTLVYRVFTKKHMYSVLPRRKNGGAVPEKKITHPFIEPRFDYLARFPHREKRKHYFRSS